MLCFRQSRVPLALTPGTLERHRCFKSGVQFGWRSKRELNSSVPACVRRCFYTQLFSCSTVQWTKRLLSDTPQLRGHLEHTGREPDCCNKAWRKPELLLGCGEVIKLSITPTLKGKCLFKLSLYWVCQRCGPRGCAIARINTCCSVEQI